MKKLIYVLCAMWVVLAIASRIFLGASWWIALSWLWLPCAMFLVVSLFVFSSVDIGVWMKRRADEKIPDSEEVCMWAQASEYDPEHKCLGEVLEIKRGGDCYKTCPHYKRHIEDK